jgi:hypothetical protein
VPNLSLEELKRLVRKIEFNKTEPELLVELVYKAMLEGENERDRLKRVGKKSHELFRYLKNMGIFHKIKEEEPSKNLRKIPIGSVDGSFQLIGGVGNKWYVICGISNMVAREGFTLQPTIEVDGDIKPLEVADEGEAHRMAEILMMLSEIKGFRRTAECLGSERESYLFIDGPIIDPPLYEDPNYIEERVSAIKFCCEKNVNVVGFVKRIIGANFLSFLKNKLGNEQLSDFLNDLDLLSTIMFNAINEYSSPIYTHPIDQYANIKESLPLSYKRYKEKGLIIYYSYYKPSLRGRMFRVELASFKELKEEEVLENFHKIMTLINKVWTLPGMEEPLPIIISHTKSNVRRGAAETLYYEIMTKALGDGNLHFWLEAII